MKRSLLALVLALPSVLLQGQITITNSHMPGSGDTLRYSNVSLTTNLDYTTTGAGITWDFSNLTPVSQGITEYKSTLQINPVYLLFFGFSSFGTLVLDNLSLGTFSIQNMYDFYVNGSSSFRAVGRGLEFNGIPIPSNFADVDEIYSFPLSYGDHDSTTFDVGFSLTTQLELFMKGSRVNDVEGWGTIVTPYGSFNCLKVKTIIYEKDSIVFNGFSLPPISRRSFEVKWLSQTTRIPVLEVRGSIIANTYIVSAIRYRDSYNRCLADAPNADFYASQTVGTTLDTITLFDSTLCNVLFRTWAITPPDFNYVNGTNAGSTDPQLQFTNPGWYTVTHTNSNMNGTDTVVRTAYILINSPAGLEPGTAGPLSLYPNPAGDMVMLQGMGTTLSMLRITDVSGRVVQQWPVQTLPLQLNMAQYAPGLYWLSGEVSGKPFTLPLVKK